MYFTSQTQFHERIEIKINSWQVGRTTENPGNTFISIHPFIKTFVLTSTQFMVPTQNREEREMYALKIHKNLKEKTDTYINNYNII